MDTSILSGNLIAGDIQTNLRGLQTTDIKETNDANMHIFLRIKDVDDPSDSYNIGSDEIYCVIPTSSSSNIRDIESITKKFTFSHIFPSTSTQEDIFNIVVKPKVLKFINGENSSLMSYGPSGSGKTFTLMGTVSEPGIIPRTLNYIFRTLPEISEIPLVKPTESGKVEILNQKMCQEEVKLRRSLLNLAHNAIDEEHTNTYQEMQSCISREPVGRVDGLMSVDLAVWVSFAEIYNEKIYDLLVPTQNQKENSRATLKLAAFNENTYIKDLRNVSISSAIEAYQILQYGLRNVKYAPTSINPHSSRSHCIFTIKIAQMLKGTDILRFNYFNFCDLAGSERSKKTSNVGDRLKEANNINTSLLILGRCISSIRDNQKQNTKTVIPYRDSKLTRLFQRALSGRENICLIVNMNPSKDMFEESLRVLNFSALARDIVVRRSPVKLKRKNRFSSHLQPKFNNFDDEEEETEQSEVEQLQDIIDKLYRELELTSKISVEQEFRIREQVIQEQAVIIEEVRRGCQERIAAQEARHRQHIVDMRNFYKSISKESEIINLDSSSDEEDCDNKKESECLQQQINESVFEVTTLKNELAHISSLIDCKDREISHLKETIVDAASMYNEMYQDYERKLNDLTAENFNLSELNSELTIQINEYSAILRKYNEEILA